MNDEELTRTIEQSLSEGYTREEIVEAMAADGYSRSRIQGLIDQSISNQSIDNAVQNGSRTDNFSQKDSNTLFASLIHSMSLFSWGTLALIIYFASDDELVKQNAINAFNWQLSLFIYVIGLMAVGLAAGIAGATLMIEPLMIILPLTLGLALLTLAILDIVNCAIASKKAYNGEAWKYYKAINLLG